MNLYRRLVIATLGSISDNLNDMAKTGVSSYCPNCSVEDLQSWVDAALTTLETVDATLQAGDADAKAFNDVDNLLDGCKPNIALVLRTAIQDHLENGWCDEGVLDDLGLVS